MYMSSAIKGLGHNVTVFNNNLWQYDVSALLKFDVVCLTGFDEFKSENESIIELCRNNGVHTVIGGAMATFGKISADATVIGEGELAIADALHSKGIFQNPVDVNLITWPDYFGFGIEEYHRRHDTRYMGVLTSRGCPHNCTFCAHTCRYSCRRLEAVFYEIECYHKLFKLDVLVVNDNTLNPSKGRFRNFCTGMKKFKLAWSAALRLDNLDEDLVKLAKDSGLYYAVVGVESFQQNKLDMMNKKITVEQIESGLELLEKHNINYHGNVLFGFDGETDADVQIEYEDMKRRKSRIFPTLLQSFSGIDAVASDKVNRSEYSKEFYKYVTDRGMYTYPEA